MKHLKFFIIAAAALLTSCSTSDNVIKDDAYYSPYNKDGKSGKELVVSYDGTFNTSKISSSSQYDYQSYYSEDATQSPKTEPVYEKIETVTDTIGFAHVHTKNFLRIKGVLLRCKNICDQQKPFFLVIHQLALAQSIDTIY